MKKLISSMVLTIMILAVSSQEWIQKLPQDKMQNGSLTLSEIQKAFNNYWGPLNVKNGYYEINGEKIKAPGWKLFKRWEWNAEHLVDGEGNFPNTSTVEEMEKYKMLYPDAGKSLSGNWTNIGYNSTNGGYEGIGRVNCIAFHPTNNNIFWVGAPSGGLWITYNGGASWSVLTDANTVLGVSAIAVTSNYATSNTIYIGTGDRDGGSGWSLGGGIYHDNEGVGILKSTNGGATWTNSLSFSPSANVVVYDLLIDPNNNAKLYAATDNGIYNTTNSGSSWTLLHSTVCTDLEFQPGNSNVFYGAYYQWVMKHSWNGSSWTWLTPTPVLPGSSSYRTEIAVSANNTNVVYALTVNSGGGLEAIYKSTNAGVSYSLLFNGSTSGNNLLGYNCNGSTTTGQGAYDVFITANPTNANDVYVGGINVWRSTNGGTSWSIKSMWSGTCGGTVTEVHADQHCCEFQNSSTIFIGNDGGIYKSTNNGTSWTDLSNTLTINQIYRIGLAKYDPNEMIIGLQDNGTHLYSAGSWVMDGVIGGDGMECFIDPTNSNVQFGELNDGEIKRTTDHWSSYSSITSGLSGSAPWVTPFIMDPNDNNTLYVGYQDVFKSTNQGTNWTQLSSWSGSTIRSIAIAPSNSNYIYTATQTILYRTTNGGSSWTNITGTLPVSSGNITYVTIKNDDPNTVWVTLGGFNTHAVYQTTNGGTTWANISTGLPSIPAMSVVQNIKNTNKVELYVAMMQGVYMKMGSANWIPFNSGLPNVFCTELEIYYDNTTPSNSKIRVGTFGRGLWESDLPVVDFVANIQLPPNAGTPVFFTDLSTNSPTGWWWSINPNTVTFTGGTGPASQHPIVQFNMLGAYTVSLTTTNAFGNDIETKTSYIHMGTPGLWTGSNSSDWSTGTNWHNHMIPTSSIGVTINPGAINWPTYTGNFNVGTQCGLISMNGNSVFTVTGNLTIPSGGQMICSANSTLNIQGDFVNYGLFTPGNSVVKMDGNSQAILSGNQTNNGSQTTNYVSGTGWVYPGAYFDAVASGGKSLSINSFDVHCNTTGSVNVEIWYKSGTYLGSTSNPGAWTQLGTTQTVTGQGYGAPTPVNPGASVTIPSGMVYGFYVSCYSGGNGYLWFSGGSNTYGNSDITVNTGDMTWAIPPGSGSWNGYTFNGTIYYSYVTSNPLNFFDLDINKTNALVTTDGNLNINNNLTVRSGSDFTNTAGSTINVTGNFLLEANASGMASFLDKGTTIVSGITTVQQYITQNQWHLISPPISGAASNVFLGVYLKYFVETDSTWHYITTTNYPLSPGTGYSAWSSSGTTGNYTANYTGNLNNSDISPVISFTSTATHGGKGWNMIGNPFPSSVAWTNGWSQNNLDNTIYVFNGVQYLTWNHNNGSPYGTKGNGDLPPGQGFWVKANNSNPSVTIPQSERKHSSQAFYKSTNEITGMITLTAEGNEYSDNTVLYFNNEATMGFDSEYDAWKIKGLSEAPQLYSLNQSDELAVNVLPFENQNMIIPLGFEVGVENTYSISISDLENLDEQIEVYLEDQKESSMTDLRQVSSYTFTATPNDDHTRFFLHFYHTAFGTEENTAFDLSIYSRGKDVFVSVPEFSTGDIVIYNLMGQRIVRQELTGNSLQKIKLAAETGYYLVKVQTQNQVITEKVFIR